MRRLSPAFLLPILLASSCKTTSTPAPSNEYVPPRTDIRAQPIPIGGKLHWDAARLPGGATG